MDEYGEASGDSSFFDVSDSFGSSLSSIADGVVDAARSATSFVADNADLAVDSAQVVGHQFAAGWDAAFSDPEGAVYHNFAGQAEADEIREDVARIRNEDMGF